jgi:hypothetical protein
MSEDAHRSASARETLSAFGAGRAVPPPPAGPSLTTRQRPPDAGAASRETGDTKPGNSKVFPFDAELELAEIDHGKTGPPWSARARTLSTSSLSFSSRRMCYVDRRLVIAVHRLDSEPLMLLGRVTDCRYDADGLYTVDLELLPTDEKDPKLSFSRRVA